MIEDALFDKSFVTAFALGRPLMEEGTRASASVREGGIIEEGETECYGRQDWR